MDDFYKILKFTERGDINGKLNAIESPKDIPFSVKRIFYLYGIQWD